VFYDSYTSDKKVVSVFVRFLCATSIGYVMVSATNERDVKLVQDIGKEIKIKYQPNAYFNSDKQIYLYEWICNYWVSRFYF
jgi:ribosome-binding factor A